MSLLSDLVSFWCSNDDKVLVVSSGTSFIVHILTSFTFKMKHYPFLNWKVNMVFDSNLEASESSLSLKPNALHGGWVWKQQAAQLHVSTSFYETLISYVSNPNLPAALFIENPALCCHHRARWDKYKNGINASTSCVLSSKQTRGFFNQLKHCRKTQPLVTWRSRSTIRQINGSILWRPTQWQVKDRLTQIEKRKLKESLKLRCSISASINTIDCVEQDETLDIQKRRTCALSEWVSEWVKIH